VSNLHRFAQLLLGRLPRTCLALSPTITLGAVVALLILLPMQSRAADLTIDDAVAMALKNNQSYLIAREQLVRAEAQIQQATAGALPQLGFGSSYTRSLKIPTFTIAGQTIQFGSDNQLNVGLTLTQPIWLGGKVFAAMKIAKIYRSYTEDMVHEAELEVTYGVRRAFLGAILAHDVVKVYQDALAAAELNLDIVDKMYSQGVVSEYEYLRAQVEVANLRPQLTQSQNRSVATLDGLKNLIGAKLADSVNLRYVFDTSMVGRQLNIDHLQSLAAANRPSLKQQEHLKDITHRAIGIAKSGRSFNLVMQSQYGWQLQGDDERFRLTNGSDWTPSWTATLNFSIPIFDGFTTTAAIRQAQVDARTAELSYAQMQEQIELDVRQAFYTYQETGERLRAQLKTIQQAEEGLKIARLRYQNGVGTQLEILSAETALTQAKTNYVQATHDAAEAVFGLQRVTGVNSIDELKEQ
jgi:outer membrane protein